MHPNLYESCFVAYVFVLTWGWTLLLNRNSNRLDKVDTENVNGSSALKKKGRSSDSCSFSQLMS